MSKRLDAIVRQWAGSAKFYGGKDAKKYRGNLKRAATAARDTATLFDGYPYPERTELAEDIELLRKAAKLLDELADDFEVAQRKADKIQKDAILAREKKDEAERQAAIMELFGATPDPETVYAMALDLAYFDGRGSDEFARTKGCERGLLAGNFDISGLSYAARNKDLKGTLKRLADNRIASQWPGRLHVTSSGERWWHAGWDDFLAWRKVREQVRNVCQMPGQPEGPAA